MSGALQESNSRRVWNIEQGSHRPNNGDESRYTSKIASFSKCLPHNEYGEVDQASYLALADAIASHSLAALEAVPSQTKLRLGSPISGWARTEEAIQSEGIAIEPPPEFGSPETALELAELYWMALLRDVPFDSWDGDPLVAAAAADLSALSFGARTFEAATLFKAPYIGLTVGPCVSQLLLWPVPLDGTLVSQSINYPTSLKDGGTEYLTTYNDWLDAQRGFPLGSNNQPSILRDTPSHPRTMRDLGWFADQSSIATTYMKTAFLLMSLGPDALNVAQPYRRTRIVGGFGTFDVTHLERLIGRAANPVHCNFQKWFHRRLRPEALAGRLNNNLLGKKQYPVSELILRSECLERILELNKATNKGKGTQDPSYLLPVEFPDGAAAHPSYPAAHAVTAGYAVTILKAWFNEDYVIPNELIKVVSDKGNGLSSLDSSRPTLTIGGELNKLAFNITWGRNMSGVHYRTDAIVGNAFGEHLAILALNQLRSYVTEQFEPLVFTRFDGTKEYI